jgi:tRNA nucleotidyltransferase (CCA-adding enzyme)
MKEPFLSAVPVLEKLEEAGYEAYFVGGSVRDYLLNRPINDVDIATSATPLEVKQIFSKTVDIGIEHGTVLVLLQNQSYEITTFRAEAEYVDYRRPKEVAFIRNLTDDLERRDFTMNAIAMDKSGKLVDPFNGQAAIKEKVIRTVGKAEDRFQEDALRMIRAIRFVSQLSFRIDEETRSALSRLVHLLENIAVERKHAELEKLLTGVNRKHALRIVMETNTLSYLPGLRHKNKQIEEMLSYELLNLTLREMWVILVFCLRLEGKSLEEFLRNWRLPIKEIRKIQLVLFNLNKRFKAEWSLFDLYTASKEIFISTEKLYLVIKGIETEQSLSYYLNLYENLPIKNRSEMDVSGQDIMLWFERNGGPWLKETLLKVEMAIIDGQVENKKQSIKEWLLECNHK